MNYKESKIIGFIGMTHLGIITAVGAAEKGYRVFCFDRDKLLVNSLKRKSTQVSEPDLIELWTRNNERITCTCDMSLIKNCDLIYISPDIATDDKGSSDLSIINELINIAFDSIKQDATVVILSQVPPGYTRSKHKNSINLFYQVETLIFGRAIERTLKPERFIVGCLNVKSALPKVYEEYLRSYSCPILPMSYESAELAKIAINMFLVSSVVTTNTLAELCESLGADWGEIVPALRLDRRIGAFAYLNPGLGISGGNLERDLTTLENLSNKYETNSSIVMAWKESSELRKNWIWKLYCKLGLNNDESIRIGLLGLSYKENTNSIKNSPAIEFLKKVHNKNIITYDPIVSINFKLIIQASNMISVIEKCDVLILATAWDEFRSISVEMLLENMRGKVIIDPYGMLSKEEIESNGFQYFSLGTPVHINKFLE